MNITFDIINHLGEVVMESKLYQHIHHSEMLLMYDANFIKFKKMPTLEEFKKAEDYLRAFHLRRSQKHVKFNFPENETFPSALEDYLKISDYAIGVLELYSIKPNQFPALKEKPEIKVQPTTKDNLEDYLTLQYELDLQFGTGYAEQRQGQHVRNFSNKQILQILAYYQGVPAGSVDIIIKKDTAEIDNLSVLEMYQRKGIGSRLQQFVMSQFHDKTVILVANGGDTARDMYRRQNYQYLGYRYEVSKVYE